jgi:hypothetical protein
MRFSAMVLAVVAVTGTAFSAAGAPGASAAATRPPAPCDTFTVAAADRLLGVDASMALAEKSTTQDRGTDTERRTCKVTVGDQELDVQTSFALTSVAGPFASYPKPKLGRGGVVLVSTTKTFPETVASYERRDVYFVDTVNKIVKHHGHKMYEFALRQSKAYAAN